MGFNSGLKGLNCQMTHKGVANKFGGILFTPIQYTAVGC